MIKIDYWHDMADEEDPVDLKIKEEAEWQKYQLQLWQGLLILNLFFLTIGICIAITLAIFAPWTLTKEYFLLTMVLAPFLNLGLTLMLFYLFRAVWEKIHREPPFT